MIMFQQHKLFTLEMYVDVQCSSFHVKCGVAKGLSVLAGVYTLCV